VIYSRSAQSESSFKPADILVDRSKQAPQSSSPERKPFH